MLKIGGEGQNFDRIRRITGYLVGDVDRFNNGKRAEEADRVKHSGLNDVLKNKKEGKQYENKTSSITTT